MKKQKITTEQLLKFLKQKGLEGVDFEAEAVLIRQKKSKYSSGQRKIILELEKYYRQVQEKERKEKLKAEKERADNVSIDNSTGDTGRKSTILTR